ncbi:MAG: thiolase family protein [Deltaproteobacteria bacterium]|nr:thiolase family protein [Deltaproteobacteria bacterium]
MSRRDVFIVSAVRTAVGSFNGSLTSIPAVKLGSIAIAEAVKRAGVPRESVDECYMGCVLTGSLGQAPARQAALAAELPISVPCTTIGKVCGSGLQAVIMAARGVALGETHVCVAGGMENMSATAYALPQARAGYRMNNGTVVDMMVNDGLWDVYNNLHMGACADFCARQENVTRQEQDDFAVASYTRAQRAAKEGLVASEIVPVMVPQKKGDPIAFAADEGPLVFNEAKMRGLKPAFVKDGGSVTAGNASSINDGGSAIVLASEDAVKKHNLKPLARVVSWGFGAREPKLFPLAPVIAVKNALKAAGLEAKEISYWEVNEAFAVVTLLAMREFKLPLDIVNPYGGAISIGHPIGASGGRILATLLNVLKAKNGKYGLATLCIGGGEGNALVVERL